MAQFDDNYTPLPEPQSTGSSRVLWLLPLALVVAAGVVGGMYALGQMPELKGSAGPQQAFEKYADAVVAKDWAAAYDQVDKNTRDQWGKKLDKAKETASGPLAKHAALSDKELFVEAMKDPAAEPVTKELLPFRSRPKVKDVIKQDDTAVLAVDTPDAPDITVIPMVRQPDGWRVAVATTGAPKDGPRMGGAPGGGRR
ncbi:MAG: hypothetical protein ABGY75_03270 [Gemmataceae bacterium]